MPHQVISTRRVLRLTPVKNNRKQNKQGKYAALRRAVSECQVSTAPDTCQRCRTGVKMTAKGADGKQKEK
jgi:hypothetical protein